MFLVILTGTVAEQEDRWRRAGRYIQVHVSALSSKLSLKSLKIRIQVGIECEWVNGTTFKRYSCQSKIIWISLFITSPPPKLLPSQKKALVISASVRKYSNNFPMSMFFVGFRYFVLSTSSSLRVQSVDPLKCVIMMSLHTLLRRLRASVMNPDWGRL